MFIRLLLLSISLCSVLGQVQLNSKIAPGLTSTLQSKENANIFVKFGSGHQGIVRHLSNKQFSTRGDKITHLVAELKSYSHSNQKNAIELVQSIEFANSSQSFEQFWISNELFVKGASLHLVRRLEALPEVTGIREEVVIPIVNIPVNVDLGVLNPDQVPWNLRRIQAPEAWTMEGGNMGKDVVVANIDTGVRATHNALRENIRSGYNWFDPISSTDKAFDGGNHGTYSMGIIAGKGIGVAPEAKWIACRGCDYDTSSCAESDLTSCGQWITCPTQPDGSSPACSKAPNVVSCSWSMGQYLNFYDPTIAAWKYSNIIPIFDIGNDGPECGTARSPGDKDVISVGSTDEEDTLSNFSSAGPNAAGQYKPDITAPGSPIYSALNLDDDSYGYIDAGRKSIATPHVAGTVALLLSSNKYLDYGQVKYILTHNTDTDGLGDTGRECGGRKSTEFPNNQYGYGRLNARKSLKAVNS